MTSCITFCNFNSTRRNINTNTNCVRQFSQCEEDDDEELDDVIVRSMTSTLTSMKRNVKKVEQTTGVDHKKLMKRYNHARKRMAKAQEQASAQRER